MDSKKSKNSKRKKKKKKRLIPQFQWAKDLNGIIQCLII